MSKSIRKTLLTVTLTAFLLLVTISFLVSYFSISRSSKKYREAVGNAALDFSETVIDNDDALVYITNRTADSNYAPVLNELKVYQQKNSETIERISLVNFSSSKGWYIYDTKEETLGATLEYSEYLLSVKAELINGRSSFSNKNGNIIELYRPLRTADDVLAGYLIISVNNPYTDTYSKIILAYFIVVAVLVLIIMSVIMSILKKRFFTPVDNLTKKAEQMLATETEEKDDKPVAYIENLDELSRLETAFDKLFISVTSGEKHLNQALYDANHDGMTHVYNKRYYQSVEQSFRHCSIICAIYFDVNNLKLMNDTLGHESGDYVITRAAEYISSIIAPTDYCFRMGGDEFLVIIADTSLRYIVKIVDRLNRDCPYILNRDNDRIKCALSFGYAYGKDDYVYEAVLAKAEENMYIKKNQLKIEMNMPDR